MNRIVLWLSLGSHRFLGFSEDFSAPVLQGRSPLDISLNVIRCDNTDEEDVQTIF